MLTNENWGKKGSHDFALAVDTQKNTSARLKLVSKQIAESEELDFDKIYELVKVLQLL